MTTKYFSNFSLVNYRFGDNEDPVFFNKLNQYVDLIDSVKNELTFYNKYTVTSGESADTLSYKLYGTTDYYWTFYLMNDHVRISGWPIASYDILDIAKEKYPYRMVTTNGNISENFPVGQTVIGQTSGTTGTIVRKIPDLGQMVIDTGEEPNTTNFGQTEIVSYTDPDGNLQTITLIKESTQYDAVHHYEDADGVWQDLTIYDFGSSSSSWTPVTYRDRLETKNDELKEIIAIRPDAIEKIVSEFNTFMKQRV
jgi:hypothetical protein